MIDRQQLLNDLKPLLRVVEADLRTRCDELAKLPGTKDVCGPHNPVSAYRNWLSGDAAQELIEFFQKIDADGTGEILHDFTCRMDFPVRPRPRPDGTSNADGPGGPSYGKNDTRFLGSCPRQSRCGSVVTHGEPLIGLGDLSLV